MKYILKPVKIKKYNREYVISISEIRHRLNDAIDLLVSSYSKMPPTAAFILKRDKDIMKRIKQNIRSTRDLAKSLQKRIDISYKI